MNARWSGWAVTAAMHGALLAALVGAMSSPSSPRASTATISARLLQPPSPSTTASIAPVERPLPRLAMAVPAATVVPPPEFQVQPTGAGAPPPSPPPAVVAEPPIAVAPPSPAPLQIATAAPAAAPVDQPASLPADHRLCSERQTARQYPAMLRERGVQGLVLLRVKVDEDGRAAEVVIAGGSGWRLLDEAARRVAQSCPYLPARRGEQRLASWVEYPVRFALQSATFQ